MRALLLAVLFIVIAPATSQARIVVDQSSFTLKFIQGNKVIETFPVAVGRPSAPTPNGHFRITNIVRNPVWKAPSGKFIPGGDVRNPLRRFWFTLSAPAHPPGSVGIHGTSAPESMGTRQSHGCVRMVPDDIVSLEKLVVVGERVLIQP